MTPLSLFDADQTHDLLWAQKIPEQLLAVLRTALGEHCFLGETGMPVAFIERIIVGTNYPWAEDWTGQVFEFLKYLSQCHVFYDDWLSGVGFGFEYPYTIEVGTVSLFPFPDTVTVQADDTISLIPQIFKLIKLKQ